MFRFLVASSLMLIFCTHVQAEIYHYVDKSGKKIFVDRLSKVPHEYRDQLESQVEKNFTLPEAEANRRELVRSIKNVQIEQRMVRDRLVSAIEEYTLPLRMVNGKPVVPVKVEDGSSRKQLSMLLDPGSPASFLRQSLSSSFSSKPDKIGNLTLAGKNISVWPINLSKLFIGPYDYNYQDFYLTNDTIIPPGVDGVLGSRFTQGIKYKADQTRNVFIFEPEHVAKLEQQLQEHDQLMEAQKQVQAEVESAETIEGRDVQLLDNASYKDVAASSAQPSQ